MFTFTLSLFYGNSSIPSRATFGCLKNSLTLITQHWLSPTNVSPLLSCQLVISTFLHLSPYPSPYPKPLSLLFILSRYQTFFSYLLSPGDHLVPVSHADCFIMVIHSYCFRFWCPFSPWSKFLLNWLGCRIVSPSTLPSTSSIVLFFPYYVNSVAVIMTYINALSKTSADKVFRVVRTFVCLQLVFYILLCFP